MRVTSEGVVIIDDKLTGLYTDIVSKVKSVSSLPIKYVLNTHQHSDHTGSNAEFLKTAEILMHRNARANMIAEKLPGPGRIVYDSRQSLFLGGIEIQMIYMGRGHTNGDSVIYFQDLKTVHTGDLVVWGKRSQGTILTPNMDYTAGHGSGKEWVATLDNVLKLDFDTAIPGHGPVLTKAQVKVFRDKMQTLNERMAALIKGGGSKQDIATQAQNRRPGLALPQGIVGRVVRRAIVALRKMVVVAPQGNVTRSLFVRVPSPEATPGPCSRTAAADRRRGRRGSWSSG